MANYFISSSIGNDANTPVQAQNPATPWQTIGRLNTFLASAGSVAGDIYSFKTGDVFPGGIVLAKNGTAVNRFTFNSNGVGAKPVITGFSSAIGWTNIGGNIWQSAAIVAGAADARVSIINGTRAQMGRFPDNFYLSYEGSSAVGTLITLVDNQLANTPNWTGAEVVVKKSNFRMDRGTITNHTGTNVTYQAQDASANTPGYGYFFQNSLQTLQQIGVSDNSWYYDPSSKRLNVASTVGAPISAQLTTVQTLISGSGRQFTTFDGLQFQGSIGRMVDIGSSVNLTFNNCDFSYAGTDCFWVSSATNGTITNCTFNFTNNNVLIGSGTSGWLIQDVTGGNNGMDPGGCLAINTASLMGFRLFGTGNTFRRVYMTNTGYIPINFQGSNILVQDCFVDGYCFHLADGGGIYTWRGSGDPTVYTNRIVDHSIVLNAHPVDPSTAISGVAFPLDAVLLTAAFYADDFSQNVSYTTCSSSSSPRGTYLHNTFTGMSITGGTFYDTTYGCMYYRNDSHSITGVTCTGNVAVVKQLTYGANIPTAAFRYRSTATDYTSAGTFNGNCYARPLADTTIMEMEETVNTYFTLANFKTTFGTEGTSVGSPLAITDPTALRFVYNNTTSQQTTNLGANYTQITATGGVNIGSVITLQPFTSAVLIRTSPSTRLPSSQGHIIV